MPITVGLLTDDERGSLTALNNRAHLVSIPKAHEEKLVALGLAEQKLGGLGITEKGRREARVLRRG